MPLPIGLRVAAVVPLKFVKFRYNELFEAAAAPPRDEKTFCAELAPPLPGIRFDK
jgi:hypothetical protein